MFRPGLLVKHETPKCKTRKKHTHLEKKTFIQLYILQSVIERACSAVAML